MAWGWWIDARPHKLHAIEGSGTIPAKPTNTNNISEYYALGSALKALSELVESGPADCYPGIIIRGDSRLVIEQVNLKWQVKAAHLALLHAKCRMMLADLQKLAPWAAEWIPREQNGVADELSRRAWADAAAVASQVGRKMHPVTTVNL